MKAYVICWLAGSGLAVQLEFGAMANEGAPPEPKM
eukprot:CAMPEP_0171286824 /NCGR_PEP_ID=MMETSP0790-20130122/69225_1 /TAXON_ID=2925 /ORGANISM="Alexandrium catenella, Strain OF101" /LENGTH=34 /DNA_ID= /DNA_START= /DNA_END= /DNA_ORIENTATION=